MKKLTVFILAAVMTIMCSFTSFALEGQDGHTLTGKFDSAKAFEVLDRVNSERQKAGLSPLTMDKELLEAAKVRAAECAVEFSHTRPNGEDCFTICSRANGENIASGQTSAASVMSSWMSSPGHKANILDGDFKSIGVGCFLGTAGEYEWVQLFGEDNNGGTAVQPSTAVSTETVFISMTEKQSDANDYFVITDKAYTEMPDERPSDLINATVGQTKNLHIYSYSDMEYQGYLFVFMQEFNRNSFTWKSSDSNVATVDANGNVKIVGGGTCNIYAYGGNIKRGHLTIEVPADLKITKQPQSVNATAGEMAVFKVTAVGNGLTYQWQYRTGSSGSWANTNLSGAKTATLSITARSEYSGRQFRCIVKDKDGNSVTSNAATLTVTGVLKITGQPESVTIAPDKIATFKVTAAGEGLTYQWQYRTNSSGSWANTNLSGAKTATLSITARSEYSGRQFRCIVKDKNGNSVTSNAATLTVTGGLKITSQPNNVTTNEGNVATFKVSATGEGLTYQWQYRTGSSGSWANTNLSGAKTATLSITARSEYNGRQFRCIVKDKNGSSVTSNAATLTVVGGGLSVTEHPVDVTSAEGDIATFKVTATGSGLTYQWQYRACSSGSWANTNLSGAKTNTLSITARPEYNGRQFRCIVSDNNGSSITTMAATLTVTE